MPARLLLVFCLLAVGQTFLLDFESNHTKADSHPSNETSEPHSGNATSIVDPVVRYVGNQSHPSNATAFVDHVAGLVSNETADEDSEVDHSDTDAEDKATNDENMEAMDSDFDPHKMNSTMVREGRAANTNFPLDGASQFDPRSSNTSFMNSLEKTYPTIVLVTVSTLSNGTAVFTLANETNVMSAMHHRLPSGSANFTMPNGTVINLTINVSTFGIIYTLHNGSTVGALPNGTTVELFKNVLPNGTTAYSFKQEGISSSDNRTTNIFANETLSTNIFANRTTSTNITNMHMDPFMNTTFSTPANDSTSSGTMSVFSLPNETRLQSYPNGTTVYTLPNRTTIEKTRHFFSNGTALRTFPNGTTIYSIPNGSFLTTFPNGTCVLSFDNGTLSRSANLLSPYARLINSFPNGTTIYNLFNGSTQYSFLNGSSTFLDEIVMPNGTVIYNLRDGTVTYAFPNGTSMDVPAWNPEAERAQTTTTTATTTTRRRSAFTPVKSRETDSPDPAGEVTESSASATTRTRKLWGIAQPGSRKGSRGG